jgi:hypothetical protein
VATMQPCPMIAAVTFGMLRPREYKRVDWMNAGARRTVTSDSRANTSMAGAQLRPNKVGTIQRAFAETSRSANNTYPMPVAPR